MKRFITAQQSHNQELTLRRSTRLTDKFQKLPDELTTKIFSKLEDDPKTLIRCSAVSKKWASFVFKTAHLSFIFSCTPERSRFFPSSKLHNHISSSAIPAIMNAFSNLESIQIKLCRCPSRTPQPPCCQNITKMNVVWTSDDSQADTCMAFDVGLLSTIEGAKLSHRLSGEKKFATLLSSSVMDFYWTMLDHRPKSLRRVVIMSAKMDPEGFRSGGKVFIRYEQLSKLRDSVSNSRVNESWLEDPQNVVYWHKKHTDKEHLLQEQVWLVYHWQFILANRKFTLKDLNLKKADLREVLDGLDAAAAGGDNGTGKRRFQYQQ
uniref:F-box domain-containing protein n=1 Tax=Populus trichocarpa TaxID=3694 RepID=A0A3N7E6T6_POPTR